jgi:hypothetical protein
MFSNLHFQSQFVPQIIREQDLVLYPAEKSLHLGAEKIDISVVTTADYFQTQNAIRKNVRLR